MSFIIPLFYSINNSNMKHFKLLIVFLMMGMAANALGNPLFFPTYPGGEKALYKFIRKNLVYPEMLKQLEAEGECTMHFTVHEDGSISDISATECRLTHYNPAKMMNHSEEEAIKKECARQMAKEGLRLIRKMKRWNPAIINDAPTAVHHSLKLTFSYEYAER